MYGGFTLVTLSKEETVASRTAPCLQRGWCCFRLGNVAFGLGIFDVFCHYVLSSGCLVGRFCPMVKVASATHTAAAFPGSNLGVSELVVSSHVPKYFHSRPTADPFLIGLS